MKTVFALVGFLGSAAGFQSAMPKPSQPLTVVQGGRTATPLGRTKTLAGKEKEQRVPRRPHPLALVGGRALWHGLAQCALGHLPAR